MNRFLLAFDGGRALTTKKKAVMLRNTLWTQLFDIEEGEGLELSLAGVDTVSEDFVREFFGWLLQQEKDGMPGDRYILVLDDGETTVRQRIMGEIGDLRGEGQGRSGEDQFRDIARFGVHDHRLIGNRSENERANKELVR